MFSRHQSRALAHRIRWFSATAGIVLVRLPRLRTRQKTERVLEVICQQGERLRNVFTVIEAHAIRKRPFLFIESYSSKA